MVGTTAPARGRVPESSDPVWCKVVTGLHSRHSVGRDAYAPRPFSRDECDKEDYLYPRSRDCAEVDRYLTRDRPISV